MPITSQDGHYKQSPAFQSTVALTAMSRVRRGVVQTFTPGSMRGLWAAAGAVPPSRPHFVHRIEGPRLANNFTAQPPTGAWIGPGGDVEAYDAREARPEDNGQLGPDRSGGVPRYPNAVRRPLRARAGGNVSQMHYARRGIITPEMEYVAAPENLGPGPAAARVRHGESRGAESPEGVTTAVGRR